jgi:hypothetical protein
LTADLLVEGDYFGAERLEPMKLGHLVSGFAKRGRGGERLCHTLALHFASEAELRMPRFAGARAVASRLSATAWDRRDGTGPKITEREKLLQNPGSFGFQGGQRLRHKSPPNLSIYIYSD